MFLFLLSIWLPSCGPSRSETTIAQIQSFSLEAPIESNTSFHSWAMKDPRTSGVEGSAAESVQTNQSVPSARQEVIVAVIDTGVDIEHPELKGRVWTDSQTGVHGWNFLGNAHGLNLVESNLEVAREVRRLSRLAQVRPLTDAEAAYFNKVQMHLEELRSHEETLLSIFQEGLSKMSPDAAGEMLSLISKSERKLRIRLNPEFDSSLILGDDSHLFEDSNYGNSDVLGGDGRHGTHVAGIIARYSEAVKIMAIRAVPQGDERDKDLVHAIEFAVEHGAKVINLSLGKYYSPHQEKVWKALQKAEANDVLIVSSAGNEGANIDEVEHFPKRTFQDSQTGVIHSLSNWIVVAASSRARDASFVPSFTNYGRQGVDLFAPGDEISSLLPGDKYGIMSGTSMAAPQVAGAAAFLWSRFPELHAAEMKQILLQGVRRYPELKVRKPHSTKMTMDLDETIDFCELSLTCGVLDLVHSMQLVLDSKNDVSFKE